MNSLDVSKLIQTELSDLVKKEDLLFAYGENDDGRYLVIALDFSEPLRNKSYSTETHILGKSIRLALSICDTRFFEIIRRYNINFINVTTAKSLDYANSTNFYCFNEFDFKKIYTDFKKIEIQGFKELLDSTIDSFVLENS